MLREAVLLCILLLGLSYCKPTVWNGSKYQRVTISQGDSTMGFRIVDAQKKTSPTKEYFWFKYGEVHHSIGAYSGKLLNDEFQVFNRDGDLLSQGYFDEGLKSGTWISWKDGYKAKEASYRNGVQDGRYRQFSGEKLALEGQYNKGRRDGIFEFFSSDTTYSVKYKQGVVVSKNETDDSADSNEETLEGDSTAQSKKWKWFLNRNKEDLNESTEE